MRSIFSIILFLFISFVYSQFSYGLELGHSYMATDGINDFDSIRVVSSDNDLGEPFLGLFFEKNLNKRISLHTKLQLRPILIGYLVYNSVDDCLFCPIIKGSTSETTNLSFEVIPQGRLISNRFFSLSLMAGVNTSFNFTTNEKKMIHLNGRHPGVALVLNSLGREFKLMTFSYVYGLNVAVGRFQLWAKYQHPSHYSSTLKIDGAYYPFKNRWAFTSFSIGYTFFELPGKRKSQKSD